MAFWIFGRRNSANKHVKDAERKPPVKRPPRKRPTWAEEQEQITRYGDPFDDV
jgi:hypothetical protein